MKYCIVQSDDGQKLATLVEELMAQGWKPQGGIAIATETHSDWCRDRQQVTDIYSTVGYAQAMVKE